MKKIKKISYIFICALWFLGLGIFTDKVYASETQSGYTISVDESVKNTVSVDKTTAQKGTKVTVTVVPESGYAIKTLTVSGIETKDIKWEKDTKKYSFLMPEQNVTISAKFDKAYDITLQGCFKSGYYESLRLFSEDGLERDITLPARINPYANAKAKIPAGKYYFNIYDVDGKLSYEGEFEQKEEKSTLKFHPVQFLIDIKGVDADYKMGGIVHIKDPDGKELKIYSDSRTCVKMAGGGYKNMVYLLECNKEYTCEGELIDKTITEFNLSTSKLNYTSSGNIKQETLRATVKTFEVTFETSKNANMHCYLHKGVAYTEMEEKQPVAVDTSGELDVYTYRVMRSSDMCMVAGGDGTAYKKSAYFMMPEVQEMKKEKIILENKDASTTYRLSGMCDSTDIYSNIRENYLEMQVGDTKQLEAFRVSQTVTDSISNDFYEPDRHYRIVAGDSVTLTDAGAPGREYQLLKAVKSGISVIEITYDEIDIDGTYNFPALPKEKTGIVIINVGGSSAGIESGIDLTQYDTVYIPYKTINPDGTVSQGQDTVEYTFKPGDGVSVQVHEPLSVNSDWNTQWATYPKNDDGSYTITLHEGRNIVELKSGSNVLYKIINAAKLTTTIENAVRPGQMLHSGDVANISFEGLELPLKKMAAVYNPGYPDTTWVQYTQGEDTIRSVGVQYSIGVHNTIQTEVKTVGDTVLTGGTIHLTHMGSPLYSHCKIPLAGLAPNTTAGEDTSKVYYSVLPDITLTVIGNEIDVINLINAIDPENYLNCVDTIKAAKDAYDLLTEDEKANISKADVEKLNTAYAAVEDIIKVIEAIDALPETITLEQREAVEAANAAYTALTPERQKAVSNADKLQKAVETMQGLVARQDRIDAVVAKINALPETSKLTKADAEAVAAARAAYDALTADEQDAVDTEKLTAAETQLSYIDAADSAMEAIAAIGEVTLDNYETKYEQIVTARSAYDNLAEGAKALVTNLDTLKKAEETYQSMDEDVKEVIAAINQLKDPLSKSSADMDANALYGIWNEYTYVVVNIRGLADELTKDKQAIVTNMKDLETAEAYIQKIKDYDQKLAEQGTAAKIATGNYVQAEKLLSAEGFPKFADYDPINADKKDIAEVAAQVAQAKAVVDKLTDEQKAALDEKLGAGTIKNLNDLADLANAVEGYEDQYKATQDELDKAAEKIRNEAAASQYVSELTEVYDTYKDKEVSRSDIAIIRQTIKAYDNLTDAQKDIIKNAENASAITAMLDALKEQDEQVQKDEKAAAEVTEYIKNLPTSLNLDNMEAVRSDLQMIADKYNALNANAQRYVRMLSKVTATNNVLNTMTAEINTFRQGKPAVTAAATAYNSVTVSWNTYQYAQSYDVYRKTAGGEWTKLGNTTALQYVDQTAAGSTAYSYTVVALSSRWGQSVSSAYDENGAAVTTPAAPQPDNGNTTPDNGNTTPDNNSTPAVKDYTSLNATSAGVSSIKLSWKKVSKASGYVVYRANSANGKYKAIKTIKKGKTTSFTDKKRTTGKTYYYKLRPYKTVKNKKQYMDYSSVVSTKAVPGRAKFTKLTAGNQKATLKWKKVSGASGYLLYRSDRRDGGFTCINSVSSRKTSYTNTKLKKGQTYYYRIRAYRKVGGKRVYGNFSVVKAVKVK